MATGVSGLWVPIGADEPKQEQGQQQHHYKFNVKMTCGGCSGAVERVLKKTEGLSSYTVSLEHQTADVYTTDVPYETVLEKIKKTGKSVLSAEKDGVEVGV